MTHSAGDFSHHKEVTGEPNHRGGHQQSNNHGGHKNSTGASKKKGK